MLQAAKCFAEYFAGAWERKELEAGQASQLVHRAEVGRLRKCRWFV